MIYDFICHIGGSRGTSATGHWRIRKACESIRDLALVDFLYSTGCRVSEAARMNVEDVDFDRLECRVLGKGNKERIVYLSPVAQILGHADLKTTQVYCYISQSNVRAAYQKYAA